MTVTPGHVFVVHGDLKRLVLHAAAIPVDAAWSTATDWARYVPTSDDRIWEREWVSRARTIDGTVVRWVDTGFHEDDADVVELGKRVTAVCTALSADVGVPASSEAARRGRPLVGLPLFGTGAGGFAQVRGDALREVADRVTDVASSTGTDFVVVCFTRADYVALQTHARDRDWGALDDHERSEAARLGAKIRVGGLALFLGAGVSMAAGVPGYGALLRALDPELGSIEPGDEPVVAAKLLQNRDPASLRVPLVEALQSPRGHALEHALLASLRVDDVVTTNFDTLFEDAAATAYDAEPAVLPWDTVRGRQRYVLKLHGDPDRDEKFVLSSEHFRTFANDHDAERSILQALMLLGRELLFVRYRLLDTNVRGLVDATIATTAAHGAGEERLATVLSVEASGVTDTLRRHDVGLRRADESGIADRRLEVFLDLVAHTACLEESGWLLDPRYAGLADDDDQATIEALTDLSPPTSSRWAGVRTLLAALGRSFPT